MQKIKKRILVIMLFVCLGILFVLVTQMLSKETVSTQREKVQTKDESVEMAKGRTTVSDRRQTPSGILFEELEQYCDERIIPALEHALPGASIAVISQDEIVFAKGYGYADKENQIPSDPAKTVYEYGSVSKLFTWCSVMKLYEEGKVDLNADIREYLPEDFKLPVCYDKPITLLHLMNHQGGFGDYVIHLFSKENEIVGLREALEENRVDQYYEPGFAVSYSNYGAGLAGYIVECVAQMPMYQYVWEEIMAPAGMKTATLNPDLTANPQIQSDKAKVYEYEEDDFRKQNATYVPMYPAGAGNGTVESLAYFAMALLDEEEHPVFKNYGTQQEMLSTSYHAAEGVAGIAHGFIEYDGEAPVYWHNGGTDHSSTFFAIVPELDFGVVLCTNTGSEGLDVIQELGFDFVKKQLPIMEKQQLSDNLPDVKQVEGDYLDFREDRKGLLRMEAFIRYLSPIKVRTVNDEQITIDGQLYTQTAPYIFTNEADGTKCAFVVENGKVVKYSDMLDYLPISLGTKVVVYTQAAVLLLLMFSVVIGLTTCLTAVLRKRAGLEQLLIFIIIVMWGGIVTNTLHIVNLIMEWVFFEELRSSIIRNCFLGGLLAVCGIAGIVRNIKNCRTGMEHGFTVGCLQRYSFYIISVAALGVCWSLGLFCLWK